MTKSSNSCLHRAIAGPVPAYRIVSDVTVWCKNRQWPNEVRRPVPVVKSFVEGKTKEDAQQQAFVGLFVEIVCCTAYLLRILQPDAGGVCLHVQC